MHAAKKIRNPGGLLRAAVLASLLCLPACASYQVRVVDSDPIRVEGQKGEYFEETMHAYFWGLVLSPQVLSAPGECLGINDVVIDRSFAHDLASVLTLGLWMPMDVRYRCKAPEISGGTIQ